MPTEHITMPIQQPLSSKQAFPLRIFATAFVVSMLIIILGGWQSWQMHQHSEEMSARHIALTEDIGRIMLFDEVLTMSARMTAATGDFSYEKKYDQFDPQLTAEIDKVRTLLPQSEIAPFVGETDAANTALVEMERQAFALTHQGRRQEATALLSGDEYMRLKKIYAGGMEKTVNAANALIEREARHFRFLSRWLAAASAVCILALLVAWFFANRSARSWAAERREAEDALRKTRDELEVRVKQRTADLFGANEQLQHEISEHELAEAKIQRLAQLYATLSQCNQAIVRSTNEEELFPQLCRDAVQFGGFQMAWVGLVDAADQQIKPIASFGEGAGYQAWLQVSADADSQFGCGQTAALRGKQPVWSQDFMHDPLTAPWREHGARFGWGSSAVLPLYRGGAAIGSFSLYSSRVNFFDEDARKLLVEMAMNIDYALDNFALEVWRRRAEEELHLRALLLDSTSDSVFAHDLDGNFVYLNESAYRGCGYTRDELMAMNPHVLDVPGYEKLVAAKRRELMEQGACVFESAHRRKDGFVMPVEVSARTIKSGGRKLILSTTRDITERKQAEATVLQLNAGLEEKVLARTAELERARLEAERASRAKSEFLATMSHEIRTPMNGVIGMVEVLLQSSLKGPQVEMANIIHDSAFALLTLIDDILDFSKIEAGKLQVEHVPMNVARTVEGVCETLVRVAEKKGVELTLFTDPAIPAGVLGDPARLRQTLINLVGNAVKFSSGLDRQGRVSVRALLAESLPEQAMLEFRVTDNGVGIDRETQKRLFSPFTQADSSTTRSFGGTGLGLAISRQLVGLMGGDITLQSEPGKGAVFSARIPFAPWVDAVRDVAAGAGQDTSRKGLGGGHAGSAEGGKSSSGVNPDLQNPGLVAGLPCLVLGDAGSLADDLALYLRYGGATVERAPDSAAAQEALGRHLPGLCVVVIDAAGGSPPLDELRAAARSHPGLDARFVVIGRGRRRRARIEAGNLVELDANGMPRLRFLEAVAAAAGRVQEYEPSDPDAGVKEMVRPLSREEARLRGRLILVAEDNEINQKVIRQQLALLGDVADIAGNGREALKLWQGGAYGILLTDLHMPEMDGYELTAAIRAAEADTARIPIIALTANALRGEAARCLAAGMDDYVSKPVQLAKLKATLEKWLPLAAETSNAKEPSMWERPPGRDSASRDLEVAPTPVPVDVNVLKALVGDDAATIAEFLHDFRLSAEKIAAELRAACATGQAAAAGALAHKLKSSARSVGALALGELCAEMERAGKADDTGALAALMPNFEGELARVGSFLEGC
ncbi:MAG: response regulator [Gallionellaceae bacterium]|nr:MAG: response regulator [Gallionellaceae bacterium]